MPVLPEHSDIASNSTRKKLHPMKSYIQPTQSLSLSLSYKPFIQKYTLLSHTAQFRFYTKYCTSLQHRFNGLQLLWCQSVKQCLWLLAKGQVVQIFFLLHLGTERFHFINHLTGLLTFSCITLIQNPITYQACLLKKVEEHGKVNKLGRADPLVPSQQGGVETSY